MNHYGDLAHCYDGFTEDVSYPLLADYIEAQFAESGQEIHTVLDLACGTGSLTWLLAQRGYEMIGADISPDMLSQAMDKEIPVSGEAPLFLCQAMEELDLQGRVDACVCTLDGINHVTDPALLQEAFRRVALFLEPGGLFLFDVLTPEHLAGLDGGMFLDESEDAYCVWRTDYEPSARICTYVMDVFLRKGEVWERSVEVQEEFAYTMEELTDYLTKAGFCEVQMRGSCEFAAPIAGADRVFFTAKRKGTI